ncbi:MAG TPA: response regulator, partial [Vicinamibacterales bacterium]
MASANVLVVDDNPETLKFLAHALQGEGFEVRTASSVLRALEALHDGSPRPSVIVTDLMMPQTTGWDFVRHLRAEPGMKTMAIVVITGADAKDTEGLANAVLQKPFDPAQLAAT